MANIGRVTRLRCAWTLSGYQGNFHGRSGKGRCREAMGRKPHRRRKKAQRQAKKKNR